MLKNPYDDSRGGCWSLVGRHHGAVGLLTGPVPRFFLEIWLNLRQEKNHTIYLSLISKINKPRKGDSVEDFGARSGWQILSLSPGCHGGRIIQVWPKFTCTKTV